MTRELSQNERRLAALASIGMLWGAFLVAIGFAVPLVAVVVGCPLLAATVALQRRAAAPKLLAAWHAGSAWIGRIDWGAAVSAVESRARRLRPQAGRRGALRLNAQATALRNDGRAVDALELIERALVIFRRLGDRRGEAVTLNGLGLTQARAGDETGARDSYETAVALLTALGDSHGAGRVLANLGSLHSGRGHEQQALAAWNDALERLEPGTPEHDRTAEARRAAATRPSSAAS